MNPPLSAAQLQLLSDLALGRQVPADIDPALVRELERAGLLQQRLGRWRLSISGALAAMGEPAR
jgi:hypothetical protein